MWVQWNCGRLYGLSFISSYDVVSTGSLGPIVIVNALLSLTNSARASMPVFGRSTAWASNGFLYFRRLVLFAEVAFNMQRQVNATRAYERCL